MWRRWRNLAIALGRSYRSRSQRWNVIGVDDVVGQSRMIWILFKKLFQHCSGFELFCVSLIGWVGGSRESQGVKDGSFDILRISGTDASHCVFIRQNTGALVDSRGVGIQLRDGLNISALTLRPGA